MLVHTATLHLRIKVRQQHAQATPGSKRTTCDKAERLAINFNSLPEMSTLDVCGSTGGVGLIQAIEGTTPFRMQDNLWRGGRPDDRSKRGPHRAAITMRLPRVPISILLPWQHAEENQTCDLQARHLSSSRWLYMIHGYEPSARAGSRLHTVNVTI